jgi:23S rRNA maturation mini-RNase III
MDIHITAKTKGKVLKLESQARIFSNMQGWQEREREREREKKSRNNQIQKTPNVLKEGESRNCRVSDIHWIMGHESTRRQPSVGLY